MRGCTMNGLEQTALTKALTPELDDKVRDKADIMTLSSPSMSRDFSTALLVHGQHCNQLGDPPVSETTMHSQHASYLDRS